MQVRFLGVGEAFPEKLHNTSVLIDGAIMLDCGYNVPEQLQLVADPNRVKAVAITHFHGDHFAGTSSLLMRCWEQKRKEKLAFIGPPGVERMITSNLKLHYGKRELGFGLEFFEMENDNRIDLDGHTLSFLEIVEDIQTFAIKVEANGKSLVHITDTRPQPRAKPFLSGCDILVHECYAEERELSGHSNAMLLSKYLEGVDVGMVALVHTNKDMKRDGLVKRHFSGLPFEVFMPKELEAVEI